MRNVKVRFANDSVSFDFHANRIPEKKPFLYKIYNPETQEFLGRTGCSWFKILYFYCIFYIILAGMFILSMQAFYRTLEDDRPKWILEKSLIGISPGLGYRPMTTNIEIANAIQFNPNDEIDIQYWTYLIDEFLNPYNTSAIPQNSTIRYVPCNYETKNISTNELCLFNLDTFQKCNSQNSYGYAEGTPCIFLKLNKIYGWKPDCYDDITQLPKDMPAELVDFIKDLPSNKRKQIWISCKARKDDDSNDVGPITYIPNRGLPSYYYPYINVDGYLSPLVAIQLTKPAENQELSIECRAWAKNIQYSDEPLNRKGSVIFKVYIESY